MESRQFFVFLLILNCAMALRVASFAETTLDSVRMPYNDTECSTSDSQYMATKVLQEILKGYDNNVVPHPDGVDVEVELIIQSISEISEISYSFKADLLFSQIYHDPGLRYDHL